MITTVYAPSVGNALRIYIRPTAGAVLWRLLRKTTDDFTGADDSAAFLVEEGTSKSILDTVNLFNGTRYFYRAYYLIGSDWIGSASASGVPVATFSDLSVDPLLMVRERLDLGLQVYVDRGALSHVSGRIPVMTASPLMEETPLPVVTVHLASDASSDRFIGDFVTPDTYSISDGNWTSYEGWLSSVQLTIGVWVLNADERADLRKAIKAILMANMPVFAEGGLSQVDMQFSDVEDFTSYSAPVYEAICTFTCKAPSLVDGTDPAISEVFVFNT